VFSRKQHIAHDFTLRYNVFHNSFCGDILYRNRRRGRRFAAAETGILRGYMRGDKKTRAGDASSNRRTTPKLRKQILFLSHIIQSKIVIVASEISV
jgi:hypothetical protein